MQQNTEHYNFENEIAICAIAKYENEYIEEWIEYHLNLGFDKIYIYDDNPKDYSSIKELPGVKKYLDEKVFIIDSILDHLEKRQLPFYQYVYDKYIFKWILLIDIDEFLTLPGFTNAKEFFDQDIFENTLQIRIPWQFYGDSGHATRIHNYKVLERYNKPSEDGVWVKNSIKTNAIGAKPALRGGIKNVNIYSPHAVQFKDQEKDKSFIYKTSYGDTIITPPGQIAPVYNSAYIKHFWTKSPEEFVEKTGRGRATSITLRPLKEYFYINEYSDEKRDILISYAKKIEQEWGVKLEY